MNCSAKLLNSLSPEERRYVMEDIHGVADMKEESSFFVEQHLKLLEQTISKVKGTDRVAYDIAMSMDPSYVQNKNFRLKFLRCDEFVVQNTTIRLMIHFTYKLELFGKEKLVQEIMFDDLSSEAQQLLFTGVYQFLRDKDIQGRTILFNFPEWNVSSHWKNFAQARWYQIMVALEEELTQRHGLIAVSIWNERSIFDKSNMKAMRFIREAVPLRNTALHGCFINCNALSTHLFSLWDVLGEKFQLRFRFHMEDSILHCLYTLQTFGINPKSVPMDCHGRPHKKWFLEKLEERIAFERQSNATTTSMTNGSTNTFTATTRTSSSTTCKVVGDGSESGIFPNAKDVILGRGIKCRGNSMLDKLIDFEMSSYVSARTKFEKTCIVLGTIKHFQAYGGRFLKKKKHRSNTNEWIIVDDNEAHKSVRERFRNKVK